jgi:hypothetical protein
MRVKWLVVGCAAFILVTVVATLFVRDVIDGTGRATTSADCQGASIDLTVGTLPDSQAVFAQVIVNDEDARQWEVEWPTGRVVAPTLQTPALGGAVQEGFQVLGDTDDGQERTVRLRPRGTQEWCEVSADFA